MPLTTVCNYGVAVAGGRGARAGWVVGWDPYLVPFCGRQAGRLGGTDLPKPTGGDDPASLIS